MPSDGLRGPIVALTVSGERWREKNVQGGRERGNGPLSPIEEGIASDDTVSSTRSSRAAAPHQTSEARAREIPFESGREKKEKTAARPFRD